MKLIITEQAYKRKDALARIGYSGAVIKNELVKALVYYKSRTLHHWCAEIHEELRKIFRDFSRLKGGKFNSKQYFYVMFEELYDCKSSSKQIIMFKEDIADVLEVEKPENMTSSPSLTIKTKDEIYLSLFESLKNLYADWIETGINGKIPDIQELSNQITDMMNIILLR